MTQRLIQLLELLKEMPNDVFLKYGIALEYVSRNEDEKALGIFSQIKTENPDYLAMYYQLGKLFERKNQIEDAINTYNLGISVARNQKDLHTLNELQNAIDEL